MTMTIADGEIDSENIESNAADKNIFTEPGRDNVPVPNRRGDIPTAKLLFLHWASFADLPWRKPRIVTAVTGAKLRSEQAAVSRPELQRPLKRFNGEFIWSDRVQTGE